MFELHQPPRRILLGPPAGPLPEEIELRVEEIWQEANRGPGVLYNGPLVSVTDVSPDRLVVRPSEYRHLVAARRDRRLRSALGVRPLAISGLVRVGDAVVIGRRGDHVSYEPGVWELVPSGGIEPGDARDGEIDPRDRLLAELAEEAFVSSEAVVGAEPFLLVQDTRDDLFDLALEVVLDIDPAELLDRFERASEASDRVWEYSRLEVVPVAGLVDWTEGRRILPVSRLLLEHRRLLG